MSRRLKLESKGSVMLVLASVATLLSGGCKSSEPDTPQTKKKDGVITRVDAPNKRLAMKIRDPKDSTRILDREIEGTITPKTEIFINGRRATIEEVKVNDSVQATGHLQGSQDAPEIVAEELRIERLDEGFVEVKHDTPASQPGAEPSGDPNANSAAKQQTKADLFRQLVDAFQIRKAELIEDRLKLVNEGKPADDPEVLKLDNMINKADESIAVVEMEAKKLGIELTPSTPEGTSTTATQPAAATQPSQP